MSPQNLHVESSTNPKPRDTQLPLKEITPWNILPHADFNRERLATHDRPASLSLRFKSLPGRSVSRDLFRVMYGVLEVSSRRGNL